MGLRGARGWREERRRGGGRGASRWVAAPRGAVTAGSSAPAWRRHAGPAPATWAREPRRVPPAPLVPTRPRGPPLPGGAGRLPLRRWRFSVDRGGRAGWREVWLTPLGARRFPGRRLVVTPAATLSHEVSSCLAKVAVGEHTPLRGRSPLSACSRSLGTFVWKQKRCLPFPPFCAGRAADLGGVDGRSDSAVTACGLVGVDFVFIFLAGVLFFWHFIGTLFSSYQFLGSQPEITVIQLPSSRAGISVVGEEGDGEEEPRRLSVRGLENSPHYSKSSRLRSN